MTPQEKKIMDSVSLMKIKSLKVISPDLEFEGKHFSAKIFRKPDSIYVQFFPKDDFSMQELSRKPELSSDKLEHEVVPEVHAVAMTFHGVPDDDGLLASLDHLDENLEERMVTLDS